MERVGTRETAEERREERRKSRETELRDSGVGTGERTADKGEAKNR